nr:putative germin-like protein 2-1 [Ipomoea batatas]
MAIHMTLTLAIISLVSSFAHAYDPSPLQDFCVASNDPKATIFVNGRACKDPKLVTAEDFFTSGLNTTKFPAFAGSTYSAASINEIPGLNTLGLTLVRNDFAPNSVSPPHIHPRAAELVLILEGRVYFEFVTVDPSDRTKNRVYASTYNTGDVFVIPQGHIHFGANIGTGNQKPQYKTSINQKNLITKPSTKRFLELRNPNPNPGGSPTSSSLRYLHGSSMVVVTVDGGGRSAHGGGALAGCGSREVGISGAAVDDGILAAIVSSSADCFYRLSEMASICSGGGMRWRASTVALPPLRVSLSLFTLQIGEKPAAEEMACVGGGAGQRPSATLSPSTFLSISRFSPFNSSAAFISPK